MTADQMSKNYASCLEQFTVKTIDVQAAEETDH